MWLDFKKNVIFPLSNIYILTLFSSSFGLVGGIGSCIVRESSGVVLGEYFRRRRQFVEQVVMAGTGVGVTLFSLLYLSFSRHLEWSQGFRIGAGLSTICVMLPAFYRTATQYNPNHRAQLKVSEPCFWSFFIQRFQQNAHVKYNYINTIMNVQVFLVKS